MAPLMSFAEFAVDVREDLGGSSRSSHSFNRKLALCRQTINTLEENLDIDRDGLMKMKKAIKAIYNSGNVHVDTELYLSKALDKLGASAMNNDSEHEIGAAYIKFSIVTKELSNLMKFLVQNLNNMVMFPLDSLLKGDLKGVKGDLKKPVEKAWREYESKLGKLEKERKVLTKEPTQNGGKPDITSDLSSTGMPAAREEAAEKERRVLQLQITDYLLKVNEIHTKKGVDLLQHMVEYYNAQTNYFRDGLKTIEHFNSYIQELSAKLAAVRAQQETERRALTEIKTLLRSSSSLSSCADANAMANSTLPPNSAAPNNKTIPNSSIVATDGNTSSLSLASQHKPGATASTEVGYSLHQLQGNKHFGCSKVGYLLKKSEAKMRVKVWQKRKCEVLPDGYLYIYHNDESKAPTKLNLLTCQVKLLTEEKKSFDLVSYNRTYHFQTEHEADLEAWISVLINCKDNALKREFDQNSHPHANLNESSLSGPKNMTKSFTHDDQNQSLYELQQSIIAQVRKLPGNDRCVDCFSDRDATWLAVNFGVVICIECSGIHRDMGVHVSRVQSLTLDRIPTSQLLLASTMSNTSFNDIVEATLEPHLKPTSKSSMETRREFIRAKYVDHKFALKTSLSPLDLRQDLENSIVSGNLHQLLQAYVEGADLTWVLPSTESEGDTALHCAVLRAASDHDHDEEGGSSILHLVDFLVQNSRDLNKRNSSGETALHLAVGRRAIDCMKLLLRSGASCKVTNSLGETPLDLANKFAYIDCVELLESALNGKKSLFENVNFNWNLTLEDSFVDFSDDELVDEKVQEYFMRNVNPHYPHDPARFNALRKRAIESVSVDRRILGPRALSVQNSHSSDRDQSLLHSDSDRLKPHFGRSRPSSVVGDDPATPATRDSFRFKQSRKIATELNAQISGGFRGKLRNTTTGGNTHLTPTDETTGLTSFSASGSKNASGGTAPRRLTGDFDRALQNTGFKSTTAGQQPQRPHARTPSDPQHKTVSLAYAAHHLRNKSIDYTPDNNNTSNNSTARNSISGSGRASSVATPLSSFRIHNNSKTANQTPHQNFATLSTTPPSYSHQVSTSATSSVTSASSQSMPRPRGPPPPLPPHQTAPPLPPHQSTQNSPNYRASLFDCPVYSQNHTNGNRSGESVSPSPDFSDQHHNSTPSQPPHTNSRTTLAPVPPPRKRSSNENAALKYRRCRALYDCEADREDELEFSEGDIILILNEVTDDDEWMEGCLESNVDARGLFPASFVAVLPD